MGENIEDYWITADSNGARRKSWKFSSCFNKRKIHKNTPMKQ